MNDEWTVENCWWFEAGLIDPWWLDDLLEDL